MGRRRQEVRQRSAKPPPPVQIRAAPPTFAFSSTRRLPTEAFPRRSASLLAATYGSQSHSPHRQQLADSQPVAAISSTTSSTPPARELCDVRQRSLGPTQRLGGDSTTPSLRSVYSSCRFRDSR